MRPFRRFRKRFLLPGGACIDGPGYSLRVDIVQSEFPRRISPAGEIGFAGKRDAERGEGELHRLHGQNNASCSQDRTIVWRSAA